MPLYAAFELVLDRFWDYKELVFLSRTCRPLRQVVTRAVTRRIVGHLRLWVHPYPEFWSLLEELNGVIGGAFVLRVLDHTQLRWSPRSLDVHLPGAASCARMKEFLGGCGYEDWTASSYRRDLRDRPSKRAIWPKGTIIDTAYEARSGSRIIRLYSVDHIDSLSAIPTHWSTLFVNAITTDRLLCAYPKTTLIREGLIPSTSWNTVYHEGLRVCAANAFRVRGWGSGRSDGASSGVRHGYRADDVRSFGDGQSLCLRIDTGMLCGGVSFGAYADTRTRLTLWQYEGRCHVKSYPPCQEWLEGDLI